MIFNYDDFPLADLGDLTLQQTREPEGGGPDAPQRVKVTVKVTVQVFQRTYDENYQLIMQAQAALAKPNAVLLWSNDQANKEYINQTATMVSNEMPEDWGTYHQSFDVSFMYYESLNTTGQNIPLTFLKDGSANTLTFDNVFKFKESLSIERFNTMRKQRRETRGKLMVEGQKLVDQTLSLPDRQKALADWKKQLITEMNGAEGLLVFGVNPAQMFNQKIRIENFDADIDHAICSIPFTFNATYTLFPDETNYATAEMTAQQKDGMNGEVALTLGGKIQAKDEASATTKMNAVIATMLAQYGYTAGQQLDLDTTPETISANADGDTFTELSYTGNWRKWKTTNQLAKFRKTGGTADVPFGNVKTWDRGYKAARFDEHRSQRSHATGLISGTGTWIPLPSDTPPDLATRRTVLLAMARRMATEVNSADGALTYGDETLVVRMDDFTAHINQAETGIDWVFSASYSLFPNEGGYATVEFSAEVREDIEAGDQYLTFQGEIQAPTGTLARAKLDALRTSTLKVYGFDLTERLHDSAQARAVCANGDKTLGINEGLETAGDSDDATFIQLTFNEDYRRRIPGNLISRTLQIVTRDDVTTGLLMTTYSGSVMATAGSEDGAMAIAIAAAMNLGANKESVIDDSAFLRISTLTIEKRQPRDDHGMEFQRVSFSYEYQSKMATGRAYLELNIATVTDTFGPDSEQASGFIVARDFATAQGFYNTQVKVLYAGRLFRNESVTQAQVGAEKPGTPGSFLTQQLRLDFSFTVHKDKPAGKVSARYSISVRRDFRNLSKTSRLRGSVMAFNRAACDGWLTPFLAGFAFGQLTEDSRDEDHEYVSDGTIDVFVKLDFESEYQDRLTGVSGIVECHVRESVTYSSTRWSMQQLPYENDGTGGISIPQPSGVNEGARQIRGTVTAATLATAEAWAWRQRALLTGDKNGGHYVQAPQIERDYEFAPRIDGLVGPNGSVIVGQNVQLYRVDFTFGEILPFYPAPV